MKHKNRSIILISFSVTLMAMLSSCATTPQQQDPIKNKLIDNSLVLEAQAEADTAREEAILVKAPRAAAETYNKGENYSAAGLSAYKNGDLEGSYNLYMLAIETYEEATSIANGKKEQALAAIAEAEAAISQTEQNATDAQNETEEKE